MISSRSIREPGPQKVLLPVTKQLKEFRLALCKIYFCLVNRTTLEDYVEWNESEKENYVKKNPEATVPNTANNNNNNNNNNN